ncbi:MAG: hypothetical protein R6V04_09235 [bacterium]
MKKFLLIVGIILVVLIIAAIIYCPKMVDFAIEKGLDTMEKPLISSLPDSSSKAEAKIIFDETLTKLKNGDIEKQKLQGLMMTFKDSFEDQKLDSLEVKKIMDELKKLSKPETTSD